MTVCKINEGAVQLDYLPMGDMTVRVVGSDQARDAIYRICKGRGRWEPKFNNWIISKQHTEVVMSEILVLTITDE